MTANPRRSLVHYGDRDNGFIPVCGIGIDPPMAILSTYDETKTTCRRCLAALAKRERGK